MNRLGWRSTPVSIRAAIGLVSLLVVLVAALQGDAATTLVVGVLALLSLAAWWRRHATAAACTLSLAVTLVATSASTEWAARHSPLVSAIQSGLVFWLFAGVVVGVVWWAPNRGRSRVVTTGLAHAVLVVASLFVVLAPSSVPVAGLCGAMAVIGWRSRRRRGRVGEMATGAAVDIDRAEESRGLLRTREALSAALADGWHVFHRWGLPDEGGVVEALLVGPGGVFVVETRDWPGAVDLVDVGEGAQAYAMDGDPRELVARLTPTAHKVRMTAELLGVDAGGVAGLVVFWGETSVPGDIAELTMLSGASGGRATGASCAKGGRARPSGFASADVPLLLIRGERLASWLRTHSLQLDAEQVLQLARRARGSTSVR